MSDTRVTYYLGAGASANAIPMVSQIRHYYLPFLNFLEGEIKKTLSPNFDIYDSKLFFDFQHITSLLKEHYSPDTFARKLWLNSQFSDLERLKLYLSIFFYWAEHKYKPQIFSLDDFKVDGLKPVTGEIDNRYDPFLANFLEKEEDGDDLRFPLNINIVSWNYDTQVERAYAKFCGGLNNYGIRRGLLTYPKIYGWNYPPELSRFIKLNGCSGLIVLKDKQKNDMVVSPLTDFPNNPREVQRMPRELLNYFDNSLSEKSTWRSSISFAWETDNPASQEALKEAREIFSKTDILAIIGYSFPDFNRLVDKDLFSFLPKHCKIYYQAPEADVYDLIDKLKVICKVENVHPVKNTDQFHIPFEL